MPHALHSEVERTIGRREIAFQAGPAQLRGTLSIPDPMHGLVLFAHGSGSSRHSPRNLFVARHLEVEGLGTLLFDLLTPDEESVDQRTSEHRFDVPLLGSRLMEATKWIDSDDALRGTRLGYFGASTGSAAALIAASRLGDRVGAIVSRGGRPDLAGEALSAVTAPTLLVVGGHDEAVLAMNERAYHRLAGEKHLAVVPGASHLFEEPGALEAVATIAREWLVRHLGGAG